MKDAMKNREDLIKFLFSAIICIYTLLSIIPVGLGYDICKNGYVEIRPVNILGRLVYPGALLGCYIGLEVNK